MKIGVPMGLKQVLAIVPWKSKGTYRYTKDQLTEPKYWFRMKSLIANTQQIFTGK